jgi:predicted dehydrogenase
LKRSLIIGYGSIGQRHGRLLKSLGHDVAVVSRRPIPYEPSFPEVLSALQEFEPDYVVIANHTSEHFRVLETLVQAEYKGTVLVEKPLSDSYRKPPSHNFSGIAVGYNLRFHPLLMQLKRLIQEESRIVSASIYCGSFLPDWRPGTDYRNSYSAKRIEGGGVLRDLSHELDYTFWLFGAWKRLTAIGGNLSSLEIDSDDAFVMLMETRHCPLVTVQINYLDRPAHRGITVNTNNKTIRVDLINNTISINGNSHSVESNRDDTYRDQHQALLKGDFSALCTLAQAEDVLLTISAAEESVQKRTWIER